MMLLNKCIKLQPCLALGSWLTINLPPMQVYQFLTAWVGDAYLQYASDKHLIFTMGIVLNVRPDQHRCENQMIKNNHSLGRGQSRKVR